MSRAVIRDVVLQHLAALQHDQQQGEFDGTVDRTLDVCRSARIMVAAAAPEPLTIYELTVLALELDFPVTSLAARLTTFFANARSA